MTVDEEIQEILQRTLPVNDNFAYDNKEKPRDTASKTNSALNGINIIGNKNIIISANNTFILLLLAVLIFCIFH